MGKSNVKGTVTPLSSMFPTEEVKKAAKQVEEKVSEKQNEVNRLREFIADNNSLINLVQKLPDELHHDIMVPFGKAAFFPGRLIHTNEFLVLLGENYYTERTAKQTIEILKRRGKSLESKVDAVKAVMQDLKTEASFFDSTASEVAEGLVDIREYEEDNSTERVSQSGSLELESPSPAEANNKLGESEDDEYAHIMSRLDELEKEELLAEDNDENDEDRDANDNTLGASEDDEYARILSRLEELEKEELAAEDGENDEDHDANAAKGDGDGDEEDLSQAAFHRKKEVYPSQSRKQLQQSKGKDPMNEEMSNKYDHQDLINQLACTGLTVEPVTKGEMSQSQIIQEDSKMLNPSINASVPSEKKSIQTSKSNFDASKAFTGSIVEHAGSLENTASAQASGSQPSKRVSRFKMQRK